MERRTRARTALLAGALALVAALAVAAAAVAGPSGKAVAAAPSCKKATIALASPLTGPAAFLGKDQKNWVSLFVSYWNSGKAWPGVPAGTKRTPITFITGDTQLNPQIAATTGARFASNSSVLGVIGFAGSNENLGGAPNVFKGGLALISGSATLVELTDPKTKEGKVMRAGQGYFHRTAPNDKFQASADFQFMTEELKVQKGQTVMVVDDAEAYGIGLANGVQALLKGAGITVNRQSQDQKNTDFSSLAQKAVAAKAKVVLFASQLAPSAQLFANQLKGAGYTGKFIGTDGTFSNQDFTVVGSYVSFYAPDVRTIPADQSIWNAFKSKYGDTTPFGAPSAVAAQIYAQAISRACSDGKVTRAEVRDLVGDTILGTSLLGKPIAFNKFGDVIGGGSWIFEIKKGGKYVVVKSY